MRDRIMINDGKYVHIWQKYKPAIVSLMIASAKESQQYKLSTHEFLDISPKKVSGYSFQLRMHKGRAINDIKKSLLAPDLLYVLKHSGKALDLSETAIFEFELDKDFTLNIRCEPQVEEEPEQEEVSQAEASDGESAKEEATKEEATKEEAVVEEVTKEKAAKAEDAKEEVIKEEAPKEEVIKEEAKKEKKTAKKETAKKETAKKKTTKEKTAS